MLKSSPARRTRSAARSTSFAGIWAVPNPTSPIWMPRRWIRFESRAAKAGGSGEGFAGGEESTVVVESENGTTPRGDAQKARAGTLMRRELEAACVATFLYSQPIGEQAEVGDLRWLVGPTPLLRTAHHTRPATSTASPPRRPNGTRGAADRRRYTPMRNGGPGSLDGAHGLKAERGEVF